MNINLTMIPKTDACIGRNYNNSMMKKTYYSVFQHQWIERRWIERKIKRVMKKLKYYYFGVILLF